MASWLADDYKIDPFRDRHRRCWGTAAQYKVAEVADRNVNVVLKIDEERSEDDYSTVKIDGFANRLHKTATLSSPMDLKQLNDHFRNSRCPSLRSARRARTRYYVTAPAASATIYLQGAHITHWQPAGQQPVLYLSRRATSLQASPSRWCADCFSMVRDRL